MVRWLTSSLQRKLSVVVTASMIVPLVALGLFAFLFSSRITEENEAIGDGYTQASGSESSLYASRMQRIYRFSSLENGIFSSI